MSGKFIHKIFKTAHLIISLYVAPRQHYTAIFQTGILIPLQKAVFTLNLLISRHTRLDPSIGFFLQNKKMLGSSPSMRQVFSGIEKNFAKVSACLKKHLFRQAFLFSSWKRAYRYVYAFLATKLLPSCGCNRVNTQLEQKVIAPIIRKV